MKTSSSPTSNHSISQKASEAITKLLADNQDTTNLNPINVTEFLTEMLTTNTKDLISLAKNHSKDESKFLSAILTTREVIKDEHLKNRLTCLKKKLQPAASVSVNKSPSNSDIEQNEDSLFVSPQT